MKKYSKITESLVELGEKYIAVFWVETGLSETSFYAIYNEDKLIYEIYQNEFSPEDLLFRMWELKVNMNVDFIKIEVDDSQTDLINDTTFNTFEEFYKFLKTNDMDYSITINGKDIEK